MSEQKGFIFNIQRYSIHDGAGIRTTVFFKGCPLKCQWCSNPESQSFSSELIVTDTNCIHCGLCIQKCYNGAITDKVWLEEKCNKCRRCTDICPTGAREFVGKHMTVSEMKKQITKDSSFYRTSGGGVTLSGGEPLSQSEFCEKLARELKKDYFKLAIETTGYAQWYQAEKVFNYIDEILYDIKHMNSDIHKLLTGVDNNLILENASKVAKLGKKFVIRIPVIGGINNDIDNITKTAHYAIKIGADEVHLLPYHRFGEGKYKKLGRQYICNAYTPEDDEMRALKTLVENIGINCQIGG